VNALPALFLGVLLVVPAQAAVVPEPAAALLGSLGMLALLRRRRIR
jgi:hypothetical protein